MKSWKSYWSVQLLYTAAIAGRNLLAGGNIISLGLVRRPRALLHYVTEDLFLYGKISRSEGIPQKDVYELLPANDVEAIMLGNLKTQTWSWSSTFTCDLVNLCLICQVMKPKVVFEIGTLKGYTSLHFALNTPVDTKIFTLDLPKHASTSSILGVTFRDRKLVRDHAGTSSYFFENTDVAGKVTPLYGDSASFDFSPYYRRVDFFFIDGSHSYEYVRSDTLNAFKCCHPGSVIAWHDFGRVGIMGVSRWIIELARDHEIFVTPNGSLAFMVVK